jgi:membrane-bound ClpP family serine protease
MQGTAITDLRPSGTALIGGKRLDVVTRGDYIEKGSEVRVSAVEGSRIVVRKKQVSVFHRVGHFPVDPGPGFRGQRWAV